MRYAGEATPLSVERGRIERHAGNPERHQGAVVAFSPIPIRPLVPPGGRAIPLRPHSHPRFPSHPVTLMRAMPPKIPGFGATPRDLWRGRSRGDYRVVCRPSDFDGTQVRDGLARKIEYKAAIERRSRKHASHARMIFDNLDLK